MAPPGELRVNAGVVWLASNTVWSTRERIRGEVLATMRYTNRRFITFTLHIKPVTRALRSVSTTRVHGQSSRAELTARELGPWTRAVNSGSGNRPLDWPCHTRRSARRRRRTTRSGRRPTTTVCDCASVSSSRSRDVKTSQRSRSIDAHTTHTHTYIHMYNLRSKNGIQKLKKKTFIFLNYLKKSILVGVKSTNV